MFDLTKLDESDSELFEEIVRDQIDFLEIIVKEGHLSEYISDEVTTRLEQLESLINKISV